MITSTYATEQVARFARQDREAAAAASRVARQARTSRRQRSTPGASTGPQATQPGSVRIPRQRRWIDNFVPAGR